MDDKAYQLQLGDSLLEHGGLPSGYVADNDMQTPADIQALVASGDCFITLATELDAVTEELTVDSQIAKPPLEKLTTILLYLQRHYEIHPKASNYRQ
jgi:hypothetical protein